MKNVKEIIFTRSKTSEGCVAAVDAESRQTMLARATSILVILEQVTWKAGKEFNRSSFKRQGKAIGFTSIVLG